MRQVQRSGERRLEVHPVGLHPLEDRRGPVDGHARQIEVGRPAGRLHVVGPHLLFRVQTRVERVLSLVCQAHVARVAAVAAPEVPGRALEQRHAGPLLARRDGCAQGGRPPPDHQYVACLHGG